ncbi:CHRD domain-containing protein [Hymenobacter qilianensis]|uniref:CHRD domain-containing protein n=2 Tax=Hymenobacter qilianensis TaxID=1385715 RepID=A0A7H0GYF1_9BACT|nr:CHRD domain-containing protein [Hymenobacter qilianensis]
MLQKLTSGFLCFLSLVAISACDQFDLDDLRKKAPPTPEISLSATVTGPQALPTPATSGLGSFTGVYNQQTNVLTYSMAYVYAIGANALQELHLHRGGPGVVGPIIYTLSSPRFPITGTVTLSEADEALLLSNQIYVDGELSFQSPPTPLLVQTRGTIMRQ